MLHNTGVLTRTRPGTVFCKIFDNGSPKLDLQSSVWKCPIGKLETPQREQNATDSSAPAAFRKHFRRKSSGPTIASHVDVTCPPEVWGRALEAPARAKLVVGRSRRQIQPPRGTMSPVALGATRCARRTPLRKRRCRLSSQ